jgi:N-acetyltransferase
MRPPQPITLRGQHVTLEPLHLGHVPSLTAVGLDPELWRLQPASIKNEADVRDYVQRALHGQAEGTQLPFAIVDNASGTAIGSTRFMDIAVPHRRLEIGATWLAPAWWRTAANSEAKLLLLTHAFEALDVQRVVFKTEALNTRSRAAILRLGATEEGTFRRHLLADDGRARDMVYFAVLADEWQAVKRKLVERLAGTPGQHA